MQILAPVLTLALGLSSLVNARLSDSARSDRQHHHRDLAASAALQERAPLPEARYGLNKDKPIRGVNLGNFLITESWMMPGFYASAQRGNEELRDEKQWILAHSNRQDAYDRLKEHYRNYFKEDDFKLMAQFGLNAVRLPIPYWTLEDAAPAGKDEVFLFKAGRAQVRQVLLWCKKYNLDVMIDLHAVPGSANNYDNSGTRAGPFWQTKQSYYDRTMNQINTIVDWYVNNASYAGAVKAILVMNEPLVADNGQWIPTKLIHKYYIESYRSIRSRVSASKGASVMPTVYFSNSVIGIDPWMPWLERRLNDGTFTKGTIGLEIHRYQAFPPLDAYTRQQHIDYSCGLKDELRRIQALLPVIVGEMSNGIALRCVDYRTCVGKTMAQDIETLNTKSKNYFARRMWEAQRVTMERYGGGWFYWSWKTVSASAWSYRDSVQQRWIPANPDERVFVPSADEKAQGKCVSDRSNHGIKFTTQR